MVISSCCTSNFINHGSILSFFRHIPKVHRYQSKSCYFNYFIIPLWFPIVIIFDFLTHHLRKTYVCFILIILSPKVNSSSNLRTKTNSVTFKYCSIWYPNIFITWQ
jgi:hypothetical protein